MIPPIKAVRGLIIGDHLSPRCSSKEGTKCRQHHGGDNREGLRFHMGPALDVPPAYRMIRTGFSSGWISHTCRFL